MAIWSGGSFNHGRSLKTLIMFPLCTQRWIHVAFPVTARCCLWVSVFECPIYLGPALSSCRWSNTRRWPNSGLILAHYLRLWPNISQVLSYRGSFLVSRWMWASVSDGGPTLTQLWFKASCWYGLCYRSPLLTRQYVGVTYIIPMSGHCVWRWTLIRVHLAINISYQH